MPLQVKNFDFNNLSATPENTGTSYCQQSCSWHFVINNYLPTDIDRLLAVDKQVVEYLIFGKEVGVSGTPHLQGTIRFFKKKRFNGVKSVIGNTANIKPCINFNKSVEYCKKDGDFTEVGTRPQMSQGKRNDIESVKEDILNGHTDMDYFMENHSSFYCTNQIFIQQYINRVHYGPSEPNRFPNYVWQAEIFEYLKGPVCQRSIIFIVDTMGNRGKSYFTSIYKHDHDDTTMIYTPGKMADMAYAYKPSTRVCFVDCPRTKIQYLSYEFLESIKNGRMFSGKYVSEEKSFNPPHVIVFMNELPDAHALSADRYQIINLNEDLCRIHPGGRVTNETGLLGTARTGTRVAGMYGEPNLQTTGNSHITMGDGQQTDTLVQEVEGNILNSVVESEEEAN